ncbi:MAG: MerR family transcriptional regulator [Bacillota bacterium]
MARIPDDAPVFPMAVAEAMTGLTRRRIRYYEKLGLVEPARTEGNRRLYSPSDIRRLQEVRRLLDEGIDLQGVPALLEAERRAAGGTGPRPRPAAGQPPGRPAREGAPAEPTLEVGALWRYEDARARLLGTGPAGSLDRLYPGDAGRLVGGRPPEATPRPPGAKGPGERGGRREGPPRPPGRRR